MLLAHDACLILLEQAAEDMVQSISSCFARS